MKTFFDLDLSLKVLKGYEKTPDISQLAQLFNTTENKVSNILKLRSQMRCTVCAFCGFKVVRQRHSVTTARTNLMAHRKKCFKFNECVDTKSKTCRICKISEPNFKGTSLKIDEHFRDKHPEKLINLSVFDKNVVDIENEPESSIGEMEFEDKEEAMMTMVKKEPVTEIVTTPLTISIPRLEDAFKNKPRKKKNTVEDFTN